MKPTGERQSLNGGENVTRQVTRITVAGAESWVRVDGRGVVTLTYDPTIKALKDLKKTEAFFLLPFDVSRLTKLVLQEASIVKQICTAEWSLLRMGAVNSFIQNNTQMPEVLQRQIVEGILVQIGSCVHMSLLKIDNYALQLLMLAEFKPGASEII